MSRVTVRVYYSGEGAEADAACEELNANGINATLESATGKYGFVLRVRQTDRNQARQLLADLPADPGIDIEEVEARAAREGVAWWSGAAVFVGSLMLVSGAVSLVVVNLRHDEGVEGVNLVLSLLSLAGLLVLVWGQWGRRKRQAVFSEKPA